MTVCISALAEGGKKVVVVADQMITANIPISYEFETDDVKKIYEISDNVCVLTAGNALYAYDVVQKTKLSISTEAQSNSGDLRIERMAELLSIHYQDYRRNMVCKRYIEPRGLSLQTYIQSQQVLHASVVQEIEQNLVNYNIGVEMIVAGKDSTTEDGYLFSVTHPGVMVNHNALGYLCVGSGAPHAMYNLIGSGYKKDLSIDQVKEIVLEAKKKSEVAPGVGKATKSVIL